MFLTSREQKLIHTFLKRGTLTISEMMEITGTSRRTLYRDLNNLQKSLPEEISLQTSEEGYFIKGDIKQLSQAHELVEYTMTERLYGEILLLIENRASILSLTDYFGISQPTVTNDLRQLEQTLIENEISLIRERGLKIEGLEENIRSVFVAAIYNSASLQELISNQLSDNKLLSILDLDKFKQAYDAFESLILPEDMTDKVRVLMELFLVTTLIRIDEGHFITSESLSSPSKGALNFVNKLLTALSVTKFVVSEITYLVDLAENYYLWKNLIQISPIKFVRLLIGFPQNLRLNLEKTTDYMVCFMLISKNQRCYPFFFLKKKMILSKKLRKIIQKFIKPSMNH